MICALSLSCHEYLAVFRNKIGDWTAKLLRREPWELYFPYLNGPAGGLRFDKSVCATVVVWSRGRLVVLLDGERSCGLAEGTRESCWGRGSLPEHCCFFCHSYRRHFLRALLFL